MWSNLTTLSKTLIILLVAGLVGFVVYKLSPGLTVDASKKLSGIQVSGSAVNNDAGTGAELPLPEEEPSTEVADKPLVRLAGYAWNGQSGIIVANGGPNTTKGSLMEQNGVNVQIVRQDWLNELRNLQMKFIEEFDQGQAVPKEGAAGIIIMGDGVPYYLSSTQQALDDKYGAGKYQLQVVGAVGLSYGEDKLIGPPAWKTNPQSMKGSLISAVIGDGDWVTAVNYVSANGLNVNPDPTTYDPDAVNFIASANDDYIESAKELIKSQTQGWTVPLKEVKNGKLTGKTINKKVDGCATWTPGDKLAFDAISGFTDVVSTREFNNQMATTLIVLKQWAAANPTTVTSILKAAYTGCNQMKRSDAWRQRAAEAVAKTFNQENGQYWYDMFQGQKGEKAGVAYNMGGTRVFNLADARQYYGITDGINRYKAVYDQVSKYLLDLNPAGFNNNVKRIVPYEEAVNLDYLKQIENIDAGAAYKADYSKEAKTKMAEGEWRINFDVGRAAIRPEGEDVLTSIYNLLVQAEDAKLDIVGHTDNTGTQEANYSLSTARAEAVKTYLIGKGIDGSRFQKVDGKGQDEPVAGNETPAGRAKNRRVVITLLK